MTTLIGLGLLLSTHVTDFKIPRRLEGVHRVVCMGDSITNAGDFDGGHGYVRLLRQNLNRLYPNQQIEVVNVGIGGQKAPDMLARWNTDVLERHPDMVTLSVGINDVWHGFYDNHPTGDGPKGVSLDVYKQDVSQMIESALAQHIRVVLVSPTVIKEDRHSPENEKLRGYVEAERDLAKRYRILFVDLHNTFLDKLAKLRSGPTDSTLHLTTDGVHMQEPGDKLMAYTILCKLGVPTQDLAPIKD